MPKATSVVESTVQLAVTVAETDRLSVSVPAMAVPLTAANAAISAAATVERVKRVLVCMFVFPCK